jgi:hypothetical protein
MSEVPQSFNCDYRPELKASVRPKRLRNLQHELVSRPHQVRNR